MQTIPKLSLVLGTRAALIAAHLTLEVEGLSQQVILELNDREVITDLHQQIEPLPLRFQTWVSQVFRTLPP